MYALSRKEIALEAMNQALTAMKNYLEKEMDYADRENKQHLVLQIKTWIKEVDERLGRLPSKRY